MPINSQRWFMRKEDYEPCRTPKESPFRCFNVKCLKCGSYKLTLTPQFDEESGEVALWLVCGKCGQRERIEI